MKHAIVRMAGLCLLACLCSFAQSVHNGNLSVYGFLDASATTYSQPYQNVNADPTGACSHLGASTINVSSGSSGGDVSSCVGGVWTLVGGPNFVIYTPSLTGGVPQSYSTLLTSHSINAVSYGVSPANGTNDTQLNNAMLAAFNINNDGQATPSQVFLPCGTLQFAHQIQIPSLVDLIGCGRGDSKQLVAPKGRGTVLQATSAFSGQAFPNNMVVLLGGSGAFAAELFGSRVDNLTIDGNGVAGGLMVADCQEMCGADRIQVTNFTNYGFFDWGADNNGNTTLVNTPWGLPANYQGSANDGPYTNFEFYPYGSATPSTVPIVLANVAGFRGLNGFTIATNNPGQSNGANTPNYCALVWGESGTIRNGHCEGPKDGLLFGPFGGASGQFGNGASQFSVDNFQYSTPQITTGCAVRLQNAKGVTLSALRGGQTDVICNDLIGDTTSSSFFALDINTNTNFKELISTLDGISLDAPITTSDNVQGNQLLGNTVKIESGNPCLELQLVSGAFPYQSFCLDSSANLIINNGGGAAGDIFLQGPTTIAMGVGVNKSGLNISSPEASSVNVMSVIGNNLSYNGGTNQFQSSNNGQSDAAALIFDQGSLRFAGSATVNASSTLTPAQVNAWTSATFNNGGTQVFGNTTVSGPVTTFTDSAGSCSIDPSQGGLSCTGGGSINGLTVTKNLTGSGGQACSETFVRGLLTASSCP